MALKAQKLSCAINAVYVILAADYRYHYFSFTQFFSFYQISYRRDKKRLYEKKYFCSNLILHQCNHEHDF